MLVVGQLLQPREQVVEEHMVTAVPQQPLVLELSSGHWYNKEAVAASHDIKTLPGSTNHSLTLDRDDYSAEATTIFIAGRIVLHGRRRRRSKRPQTTVPTLAV
ncbi:hypothetical protein HPB52_023987 [Rhipicephalus sanguineus]|uniref:Uncharacterized protein n=1 Tax=Rhipicephalus sanguineus TaxID=34632 RepID=A0A9D4Q3Z2_RHISA|nr:hypothetical protein HPB52_023987 [Rhipicephalus sanguineus]